MIAPAPVAIRHPQNACPRLRYAWPRCGDWYATVSESGSIFQHPHHRARH